MGHGLPMRRRERRHRPGRVPNRSNRSSRVAGAVRRQTGGRAGTGGGGVPEIYWRPADGFEDLDEVVSLLCGTLAAG